MRNLYGLRRLFQITSLIAVVEMSGCAAVGALPFNGDSWQEEVLLHDGTKIVVRRSQSYGGGHEIGQPSPIKEHAIAFTLPESGKRITWTSEYDESLEGTNFKPLALHILKNTPYIVVTPNLMLFYDKWGRPNPPYVFFEYEDGGWKRIGIETFPPEFKNINLVINTLAHGKKLNRQGFVSLEMVAKLNSSLTQEEYKTIHRTPLEHWKPRPESKSPKTPYPIIPAETAQSNQ